MKNVIITTMFMAIIMAGVCHSGEAIITGEQFSETGSLYQSLNQIPYEDRINSTMRLIVPDEVTNNAADLMQQIESKWNSGWYFEAIKSAEELAATANTTAIDAEFSWDTPMTIHTFGAKSDCYLVSTNDSARVAEYDIQRLTGNMLAVLVRAGDGWNSNVSVYFSNDGGQVWVRKYQFSTNDYVTDADCAIYGDYCLVAFATTATAQHYLHIRLFSMSDGSWVEFPSGQMSLIIWSSATAMKEIVVISTQDINIPKYYTYFIATLEAIGNIRVLMADEDAEDWFSHSTPNISNARCGLDMCLNEYDGDYASPYSKFISSYDDNNYLRIFGYMEGPEFWDDVGNASVAPDVPDFTAIDAYQNNVHCIFENYSGGEEYCRIYSSFNGGSDWSLYIFEADHEHHCPDLTARAGSGLGVAYRIHWSSPPYYIITSRFKHGDYDYDPWYGPETVLSAVGPDVQPDLEFLPSGYYGYLGIVWSGTTPGQAYFCTMGYCCETAGDANNDGGCNIGDAVYLTNYVFRASECAANYPIGCPPVCPPQGDANADGNINIGDAVFLNNYVFRPATSPAPTCP